MIGLSICIEEMQKARDLEQMARPITHPSQLEFRVALTCDPESLDQRRDAGAVEIAQLRQIDNEGWRGLLAE
jgi:hypothetical protein